MGEGKKPKSLVPGKALDAFDKGEEEVFTYYTLKAENYKDYGLPKQYEDIKITSDIIIDEEDLAEQFNMKIIQIKILYFNTGFGFLLYQIHHKDDSIETITNKSFALSRAFVQGRKSGKQVKLSAMLPYDNEDSERYYSENNDSANYCIETDDNEKDNSVSYSEISNNENDNVVNNKKLVEKELNIIDITNKLLKLSGKDQIELFPASCKNQCYYYHRIFLANPIEDEEAERHILYLRKGFHRSFVVPDEEDSSIFDFTWKQNKNIYWGGSMKGVVSLSYGIPGENNYFVSRQYQANVRNHYFLLYMILLHQRQVLLYYNYLAVKEQNNMKKLEKIKKELIRFRINFAYKTVSDEASYQKFYHGMYDCLSLESLNSDIQDVIDRVTEYQDFTNEKSMNRGLTLITLFSIFSALADGIGFADRVKEGIVFTGLHWFSLIFIILVVVIVIITFIKNFFRK